MTPESLRRDIEAALAAKSPEPAFADASRRLGAQRCQHGRHVPLRTAIRRAICAPKPPSSKGLPLEHSVDRIANLRGSVLTFASHCQR